MAERSIKAIFDAKIETKTRPKEQKIESLDDDERYDYKGNLVETKMSSYKFVFDDNGKSFTYEMPISEAIDLDCFKVLKLLDSNTIIMPPEFSNLCDTTSSVYKYVKTLCVPYKFKFRIGDEERTYELFNYQAKLSRLLENVVIKCKDKKEITMPDDIADRFDYIETMFDYMKLCDGDETSLEKPNIVGKDFYSCFALEKPKKLTREERLYISNVCTSYLEALKHNDEKKLVTENKVVMKLLRPLESRKYVRNFVEKLNDQYDFYQARELQKVANYFDLPGMLHYSTIIIVYKVKTCELHELPRMVAESLEANKVEMSDELALLLKTMEAKLLKDLADRKKYEDGEDDEDEEDEKSEEEPDEPEEDEKSEEEPEDLDDPEDQEESETKEKKSEEPDGDSGPEAEPEDEQEQEQERVKQEPEEESVEQEQSDIKDIDGEQDVVEDTDKETNVAELENVSESSQTPQQPQSSSAKKNKRKRRRAKQKKNKSKSGSSSN